MSILKNINYLKKFSLVGCAQPDIFVEIETFLPAAAPALLNLLTPGCTDIVKMKLGISPWHRKSISGLIKGAAAPFSKTANNFLYKIGYFTAERGLYYLMVADIAVEFAATWQSMVYAAVQCPLPNAGTAYGGFAAFIYGPDQDTLMQPAPEHNVAGMAVGLHGFTIFPGFQGSVAYSCDFDSWPERGQGVNAETWMEEVDIEGQQAFSRTNDPPSQPHNQTASSWYFDTLRNLTRKDYVMHVHNTGETFAQIVRSSYTINMSGHPSGVLPWGCKPKKTTNPFGGDITV